MPKLKKKKELSLNSVIEKQFISNQMIFRFRELFLVLFNFSIKFLFT